MTSSSYFSSRYIRVVWPLAVAETLLWAAIYYVFPAMLPRWEIEFGWTRAELTGALTLCLIVSAICAPFVGALIDRGKGRRNMIAGGIVSAAVLAGLSQTSDIVVFYGLWIVMGVAQSVCLYEPCFAILTRLFADSAKRAITVVTLVAGLAGTVSFPAAHLLSEAFGWRIALLVFAGVTLVATIIAAWALAGAEENYQEPAAKPQQKSGLKSALGSPVFWLLAIAFAMTSVNHGALLSHLLLILQERKFELGTAVLAASMIGPMQVIGRLGMMAIEAKGFSIVAVGLLSFSLVMIAATALYFAEALPALVAVFVICQGAGYGVISIVRPSITASFLGRLDFGAISGAMAIFSVLGFALAPTLASFIWARGGYDTVLICAFGATTTGLAIFLLAIKLAGANRQTDD